MEGLVTWVTVLTVRGGRGRAGYMGHNEGASGCAPPPPPTPLDSAHRELCISLHSFYCKIIHCLVLGFTPMEFVGVESSGTYSVQAGFLSGRTDTGGLIFLELEVNTASMYYVIIIMLSPNQYHFYR